MSFTSCSNDICNRAMQPKINELLHYRIVPSYWCHLSFAHIRYNDQNLASPGDDCNR